MTSTHTGFISSVYDFAVLLAVFPVCHWGNTGHKGRWIGIGALIMSVGSFICALPHYIGPVVQFDDRLNESDYGQCLVREKAGVCADAPHPISSYFGKYFLLFVLGQCLHGFGSTPLFSIGTTYIDENVSQQDSPFYLAINAVITAIGPTLGFFIAGPMLNFYTDFDKVSEIPLDNTDDPRWIGAWWLGFLGCGVAAFFAALPILGFARELPEAKKHRMKDVNQVHQASQLPPDSDVLAGGFRALCRSIWNILRNPTFLFCIVLGIFEGLILNGFAAFMPKILETILGTSPMMGTYLASAVIIAAAIGVLVGGAVIRKMSLQVGGMLKMIIVCHVISLLFLLGFLINCPSKRYAGITEDLHGKMIHPGFAQLSNGCNSHCTCSMEFNPVCDENTKVIYYSACLAGCSNKVRLPSGVSLWEGCGCLVNSTLGQPAAYNLTTLLNPCGQNCGLWQWVFMAALFISVIASFAAGIPAQQIMLRVVPFEQRTLAIGVNWTIVRLLGFIPGGIIFGVIIDTTCLQWENKNCSKGSCKVYDPQRLALAILAVAVVCKLVAILSTVIGYITYRPNDLDNGASVQTTDSRGPLSLVVNDDRHPDEAAVKLSD